MKIPPFKFSTDNRVSLLTDLQIYNSIKRAQLYWEYQSQKVWAEAIGWKRETFGPRQGQMGTILVNSLTRERWHYGVDPCTFELVRIGPAT